MNVIAEFHFDFGSPNAYLAHRVIPGIEARTRAKFRYVPVLLGGVFKIVGAQDVVDYVESHIADHPYFAGDVFSAADIMMEFVATYISVLPFDPASYRNLAAWQKKVQARPAYQRAIAIGAPDGLEKFRMPRR